MTRPFLVDWPSAWSRLTVALLLALTGCVSPPPTAVEAPSARVAATKPSLTSEPTSSPSPALWTAKSSTATVHLFGSVHVATPDMYPLPESIENRFAQADVLVLEVELGLDGEAEANAGMKLLEVGLLPKDETLWQHIDAETATLVRRRTAELGLQEEQLAMFRPWFVSVQLTMAQLTAAGFDSELGLDRHFRTAAGDDKPVLALETVDDQVALFSSLGSDAQGEDLRQSLETDPAAELRQIAEQWKRGELTLLEQTVELMRNDYPAAYDALLKRRNVRMVERLKELLATQRSYFVVVGAAHLVGPDGLVALLQAAGQPVERL